MRLRKKGAFTDLFIFLIIALVLAFMSGIFLYVGDVTKARLLENAPNLQRAMGSSANATNVINSTFGKVPSAYQALKWITTVLIAGMMFSIILSAFLTRIHPVFFLPYIFIVVIAVIVAVPISNVYETVYQNPTLASSFAGFYGQHYIFSNLPTWIAVIGFIAGIVMYINTRRLTGFGG